MELVEAHLFQSRREKQHVYLNWRKTDDRLCKFSTLMSYFTSTDTEQGV